MKNKSKLCFAGVFLVLFILLIILVRLCDVSPIGPKETSIGLSRLNGSINEFFGVNMTFYDITDYLGYLGILLVCIFGLIGFIQLIKRKSLLKVDPEILSLGVLFIVVLALYVLFEVVIINYRPIIMPECEMPEASFPSSHTMLSIVTMGGSILVLKKYIDNKVIRTILQIILVILIIATVVLRLMSGVHWFTDIIGGILISASLLFAFSYAIDKFKKEDNN